ncbi:MAG: hypothetical protein ACXVFT_23585 [Solirubrobacteraceae bacterium]
MVTAAVLAALVVPAIGARAAEAPSPQTLAQNAARAFTAAGDRAGNAVAIAHVLGAAPVGGAPADVLLARDRGGSWQPTSLPGSAGGTSFMTAASGDGAAAVAWRRDVPGGSSAIEATVRQLSAFEPAQRIAGPESERALNPAVAVAADGRAIVAFQTADSAARPRRPRVAIAIAPPGGPFRTPITVSASRAGPPVVAIDSAGRAVVAWVRAGAIEAASVSADGRPGRVRRFAAGNRPTHPIVAIAPRGHAVIAWTSAAPPGAGVRAIRIVRRLGTRRFTDPKTLAASPKGTFTVSLAATVLDQGRPVVAWSQIVSGAASPSAPPSHRSAAGAVWMATMRPSGHDARIRRLSPGGDDVTGAPALAASPDGLVAAWSHHLDDTHAGWVAATADLAARFGAPTTIGPVVTSDSDILSAHTVAFSAGPRRWTVLWTQAFPAPSSPGAVQQLSLLSAEVPAAPR